MKRSRFRKWLKRALVASVVLALLLVLTWVFRFTLFGGLIRDSLTGALHSAGIEAEYDDLSGSLLGDFTLSGFTITDSPGVPAIESAAVRTLHARYSIFGLALGHKRWIREISVDGVTISLDLAAPAPPPTEETPPGEPLGIDLLPGRISLTSFDVMVRHGEELVRLRGAELVADAEQDGAIRGAFGAGHLLLRADGREYEVEEPGGEFEVIESVASVLFVAAGDAHHKLPIRVDFSRFDRSEIDARLDFPLLDGHLAADIAARLGGEFPAGEATIRLTGMDPSPVLAFLPELNAGAERVSALLTLSTPGDVEPDLSTISGQFELTAESPTYEDYHLELVSASGEIAGGRISAEGLVADPKGTFELNADLVGDGPLEGSLDIADLDIRRLRIDVGGHLLGGEVSVRATVAGTIDEPSFKAEAAVAKPAFDDFAADLIEFTAFGGADLITISQLVLSRGPDRVTLTGAMQPAAEPFAFEARFDAKVADFADYRELVDGIPSDLTGRLSLKASLDGNLDAPGAEITGRLVGAGAAGVFTRAIDFTARAETAELIEIERLTVTGEGDLPDLTIRDVALRILAEGVAVDAPTIEISREDWGLRATVRAALEPAGEIAALVTLQSLDVASIAQHFGVDLGMSGNLTGTIDAFGTPDDPRATLAFTVENPRSNLADLPEFTARAVDLRARFEDDLITLESLLVRGKRFSIQGDASVPFSLDAPDEVTNAKISGGIKIQTLPLDLAGPLPGIGTLEGTLDAELSLSGSAGDPRVSGQVRLAADRVVIPGFEELPITDVAISILPQELGAGGGTVVIEEVRLAAGGAQLTARGSVNVEDGNPLDPEFRLAITAIDIGRIRRALGVEVPVEGLAQFGLTVDPGPVVGLDFGVRDLALPGNPDMTFDLGGEWREGTFTLSKGRLDNQGRSVDIFGTIPFDLSLSPLAAGPSPDRAMDVGVKVGGLELASLDLDQQGIRLAGTADADVRLGGLLTAPEVNGLISLKGVRFRAEGAPGIDKLSGSIAFSREEVRIEELTGTLGRGPFSVSGTVALIDGQPGAANLAIKAENAQLVRSEGMRMRTDLDLTLRGTGPADLTVGGTVKLRSLKVGATGLLAAQDIETVLAGMRSSPSLAPLPLTTDPMLKDVALDLTLLIPEGAVHVRTNLVKATAHGKLQVGGTLAIPRPRGRIYVPEGTVFLIAGRLELEKPVVTFHESDPLVPYINGRATARVSGVDVFVNVSGSASNARVLFSSVPSYPVPDIVSLILTGVTRANLGSDALSGMASTYLLRQLSSNFSEDDGEDSLMSDLVSRIEVEFDDRKTKSGGIPGFTATVRILDWLFVRGQQESALDYGFDLIFRLTFP